LQYLKYTFINFELTFRLRYVLHGCIDFLIEKLQQTDVFFMKQFLAKCRFKWFKAGKRHL